MNIVISNDPRQGQLILTAVNEGRSIVLRRINGEEKEVDYLPWESISKEDSSGTPFYAATLVHNWACDLCRSKSGINAARRFLRQWPDGPQAEPEDIKAVHSYRNTLREAAKDIAENSPPLNEMNVDELCLMIRKMLLRLKEFRTDSPHAYLLRLRISAAAGLIQMQQRPRKVTR